jgi:membrane associated rhomboid family serine protease
LLPLKDNIPTRQFPLITVVLIAINIAMFFGFQHAHWSGAGFAVSEKNTIEYAYIPYELTHSGKHCGERALVVDQAGREQPVTTKGAAQCEGKTETLTDTSTGALVRARVKKVLDKNQPSTLLTIFTSMFMHGGLLHIAGNMLFLWIFGNNVEDAMGKPKFILFYLLGGLAATALQTAVGPNSTVPNLGASGAIAAVLGGYALLYPRARVVTLIFIIFFVTVVELPALLVLGGWFLLQVIDASQPTGGGGGVAYFAHIGGFIFGLLAIKLLARRVRDDYVEPKLPVY